MLWLDLHLALVTFSIVPALFVAAGYFRLRARDAYRRVRERLAHLNGLLQESLQGMAVIQLFARERYEAERFREANGAYHRAVFASTSYDFFLYASVEALGSIAVAVLLWYGGGEIIAGAVSFGVLVAFIQYTNRFFLPIRDLGAKYTVMQSAMASSERIFGLLDRSPAIVSSSEGASTAPSEPPPGKGCAGEARARTAVTSTLVSPERATPRPVGPRAPAVELQGGWVAYEGEEWGLRDCSLRVAPGDRVALV